jgi:general secretion pathway protein D
MAQSFQRLCLVSVAVAALLASPVAAQPPGPARGGDVVINMRDVDLPDVAQQISRITGRTLILDPAVKGTVNVVSADALTPDGVWDLFLSVLRVHGFAAVRSGAAWRIVPQAAGVQGGGSTDLRGARSQDLVTSLIRLRNLPSDVAARVFKPLVATFGAVEALPRPNAIVITDYADNVRRIERLALALDGGSGTTVEAVTLRYASARDVVQAIQRILGDDAAGGPRVAVDERSNIVIIRGDADAIAQARRVALVLDVPGGAAPTTKVFRLNNNDAETVTEVLRGVMGGQAQATNPVAKSLSGANGVSPVGATPLTTAAGSSNPLATALLGTSSPASTTRGTGGIAGQAAATGTGFTANDISIQSSPELNAIVVRGSATAIASVGALIAELDVRRPQVMIEAAIVEITGDAAEQLGIQLGSSAAAPISGAVGATSFTNAGISLPSVLTALGAPATLGSITEGLTLAAGRRNEFSILVQALSQSTNANLLSTPSLTTLDNQPAEIVVGQNVPFRTGSFTTTGNTTDPFTTITRQDVGITLHVVPRVHEGDVIRLEVSQEVSSLVNSTVVGAADLVTNRRSIQTTVLADNGQTIVLGGLITDDRISAKNQVPILGDIPVLGNLFKSRSRSQTRRTLFVFLRPTILRDPAATAAAAQAKYDRLRTEEARPGSGPSQLLDPPPPRLPAGPPNIYR